MKKVLTLVMAAMIGIMVFTSCGGGGIASLNTAQPKKGDTVATMKTSKGDIKMVLFKDAAPKAVENFTTHAENGYYNGLTFHRVMSNFMIQGGDPDGNGTGGKSIWDEAFEDEFSPKARNIRGALSMANSGKNTNGSQFFIVQAGKDTITDSLFDGLVEQGMTIDDATKKVYKENGGTPWLDDAHTVFGQVYEGMDIVDAIAAVEVDANAMPIEQVTIDSIEIGTYE